MKKSFQQLVESTFPKIIGVGKNYLAHAKEMGAASTPDKPILFLKPWTTLIYNPTKLFLDNRRQHRIDHEIELGVLIGKRGKNIQKQAAMSYVTGYFLLLDLTDRNYQKDFKDRGLPWELSKGQDNFCPVSSLFEKKIDPYTVDLELKVNQEIRQKDRTNNMIFKIDQIISYTSQHMTLCEGDLILMGTPSGVGPLKAGDNVQATASSDNTILAKMNFEVIS